MAYQSNYSINGINFKDYGVYVSESEGLLNRPKLKGLSKFSWDNYHGEDVDLTHKYYEARDITLTCFIKATDKIDFLVKLTEFEQLFDARGLQRLFVDVHPTKPLVYEVYCKDEISVSKRWSEHNMIGTFKLKLTEPYPIKRVLKYARTSEATKTCTINITTSKYVNVFWGDGRVDEDIAGKNVTLSHEYKENKEYLIIVTGCIDEITSFNSNATLVWNKL